MTLSSGDRLGPYQIESSLGAGGMGEVYRARDTRLDRTVAIKVLPTHMADQPGLRERFEREARAISAVEHPNICALYDVGLERGVDFLVMQYIAGKTLADRLQGGPLPVAEALRLAQQIVAGLEAAHERGIVHRDLKPSNIALTSDGHVKLVDFGIAKILSTLTPTALTTSPTVTASPTEMGAVLGTPSYMSPEQAFGKPVDKRADIWAFGCVLFEMLAGRRPFPGQSASEVMIAVVDREPDWNALPPATPRRIRDLLRHCLQKDPSRRLRDIGDARLEIDDAVTQPQEASGPTGAAAPVAVRRASAAIPWSIAVIALLIAAVSLFFWRSHAIEPQRAMRFSSVTNFAGVEDQPTFSPDGRSVAFVSNRDGQWDIYVSLVTGGSLIRITDDSNVEFSPRWSPDGTKLLFARLNDRGLTDIWVAPSLPGIARQLISNGQTPAWAPDGQSIAYSAGGAIWICDSTGANPRAVTKAEPLPLIHYQPAFSHDHRSIVFVRRRTGPRAELALVDIATGSVRALTEDDSLALSPVWSPDNRFVYFSSSRGGTVNVWRLPVAGGDAVQITAGQGDDVDIDLSADGERLVFSTSRTNTNLAEIDIEAGSPRPRKWLTTDAARSETAPRYSPDGRHIAYFSNRNGAEREGIWVMDADGANATRLVDDDRTNVYPRWSPHGESLFYYSRAPGIMRLDAELRRVAIAGGPPQTLSAKPSSPIAGWGDVAGDGRLLYRTSDRVGELYDPRTNRREPVTNLFGDPLWSSDGQQFAFLVRPDAVSAQEAGLWIGTLDGVRRQLFNGWVISFAWTRTGQLLFLEGKPDSKGILWRMASNGERTVVARDIALFRRPVESAGWGVRFDVHPDGHHIAIEALEIFEADIGLIDHVK